MSCQPHRVTSGQSNSGHKQVHVCKLFSHTYQPSVKSVYKTNHFANIKHTYTNTRQIFRRVSPFYITPVKRAHKARTCCYRRPFRLIYRYHVKEKYKKRNRQTQYKILKCYINAYWQIPVPYGSKLHIPPTNYHLLAAQQEPYKKAYPLTKNI